MPLPFLGKLSIVKQKDSKSKVRNEAMNRLIETKIEQTPELKDRLEDIKEKEIIRKEKHGLGT